MVVMKSNDVTLKSLLKLSTDPDRIPSACDVPNMTEWQPTNQPTNSVDSQYAPTTLH